MADEQNASPESQDAVQPETYSKEDISKIVQERLARQAEKLKAEQEAAVEQARQEALNSVQSPVGAPPVQPPPQSGDAQPLTYDTMSQLLQQTRQQEAAQRALQFHEQNIQKMKADDPKFAELEQSSKLGVPGPVAIHISNSFSPERAKSLFKQLLSDENANLKMNNAYLSNNYDNWLNQIMKSPPPEKAPETVPDLAAHSTSEEGSSEDPILDYVRNQA